MILHEINYKMPIYKSCTLGEMLAVGACVFIIESITLLILTRLLFNLASIGFAITMLSFFHISKYLLGRLEKVKYGKPQGYYKHSLIKKISAIGLLKCRYLTRQGRWSVRRM
jgi:conjugative transfer region protein (TIGR03750 family)